MGVQVLDVSRIEREFRYGRPFLTFLAGTVLIPLLLFFLFLPSLGWGTALIALASGFVLGAPLTVIGMRGLSRVNQAWSKVMEVIREEWRTGARLVPDDVAATFPGIVQWREVPTFGEADLPKLKRATLVEKWSPTLLAAMFVGFGVPYLIFLELDWRGIVPVVLVSLTTFGPLAAVLYLAATAGSGITLLARLKEYERATGKSALPKTLRGSP